MTETALSAVCGTCKRTMNVPDDPRSIDCGGDCVECMAAAGDPDCIALLCPSRAADGERCGFHPLAHVFSDEGQLVHGAGVLFAQNGTLLAVKVRWFDPSIAPLCRNCLKPYDPTAPEVLKTEQGREFCSVPCLSQFNPLQEPGPRGDAARAKYAADNEDRIRYVPAPLGLDVKDESNAEYRGLLARDVSIERVLELQGEVTDYLDDIERKLKSARARQATLRAIAIAKLQDIGAKTRVAPSTGWQMVTKPGAKKIDKRTTVLKQLADLKNANGDPLIPPDRLKKAIWLEVPEPYWNSHLTYLRKLDEFGDEVKKLLDAGIVESEGPETVVFERIEPTTEAA